jgi:outer membrane lipoprotein LolB
MRIRLAAALAAAALTLLAAGCRTVPVTAPAAMPWEERRAQLQARAHFELGGRVAVAAGEQGFNANLHWIQNEARSQLTLQGPLGIGGMRISASGEDFIIVKSDGESLGQDAARAELAARLGFDPPIARLRYWIQGVPDPAVPANETLDAQAQHLDALAQDGWTITYSSYTAVRGEWLPARLSMQRDTVRLRVLVDEWQW